MDSSQLSRKRSHSSSQELAIISDVRGSKKSAKKPSKKASKKRSKEKSHKTKSKKKRKKRYSSSSSDSSDSSSDSSTTSSSSSNTSTDSNEDRKRREKKKKKKSKKKKISKEEVLKGKQVIPNPTNKNKKLKIEAEDGPDVGPNIDLQSSKIRAPMTKEEYEKQQSTLRWVDDPETGRRRLIRGSGEIVESMVSKERHQAINKQATAGDGQFFQNQSLAKAKSSNQK